jgi:hypothetical protein
MSKKYGVRYIATRKLLTTAFWSDNDYSNNGTNTRIVNKCNELGGESKYDISQDGFQFTFECIFNDKKSRDDFVKSFEQVIAEEKDHPAMLDRIEHNKKNNIETKVEIFEEDA